MESQLLNRFLDDQGIFEIKVPFDWKYTFHNEQIHVFNGSEIWGNTSFQISMSRMF
jgi:hypothetical protein